MTGARRVLVGITGGIAAYKIPLLVRLLRKNGCEVKVALTEAAKTLVGADALRTLSGNPVYTDGEYRYDMDHIRLSEWADVFVICPATANTIAKMACGIADNLITTLALSIPEEKIIVAPAMNSVMWENKATRANVYTLMDRGIDVLPVEEGELACGVRGPGRMVGIETIASVILTFDRVSGKIDDDLRGDDRYGGDSPHDDMSSGIPAVLSGYRVLISSGPTEEPIDPVRVITNKSSGKMGAALARAAAVMGADVTVVSGPSSEPLPFGVDVIPVKTAAEMEREMTARFGDADICVMAAAVSDYRPVNPSATKLHRSESGNITLELTPNPDILAKLGASKSPRQFLVGFSLESGENGMERAAGKMNRKNCDMMVFNEAGVALGGADTRVTLLDKDGAVNELATMSKDEAAIAILKNIANRVGLYNDQ